MQENTPTNNDTEAQFSEVQVTPNAQNSNLKETFLKSIFADEEIETLSKDFLPFGDYFNLTITVFKRNFWKAFLRPFIYIVISIAIFLVLSLLAVAIDFTFKLYGILSVLSIIVFYVALLVILINFSIRSYLVVVDPSDKFLSEKYKVMPIFWNLLWMSIIVGLLSYSLNFLNILPLGGVLSLIASFLFALFTQSVYWIYFYEKKSPLTSLGLSYELVKDRFAIVLQRNIIVSLLSFVVAVILAIIGVIAVLSTGFATFADLTQNNNPLASSPALLIVIFIIAIILISAFVLLGLFTNALSLVNYVNLRLSPKNNEKGDVYFDEYKLEIRTSYLFALCVLAIIIGSVGVSKNTSGIKFDNLNKLDGLERVEN